MGHYKNQLNQVVTSETITNGQTLISGANISQITVRSNFLTDSYVNLFYSFGLPNSVDDNKYTGTTYVNGGYSDTALSAVAKTKIVVISVDTSQYGETIDGKSIKISLPTSGGTYNIYTFQNKGIQATVEDANLRKHLHLVTHLVIM
jgi:hypothetical protein